MSTPIQLEVSIQEASVADMLIITKHIKQFRLDSEALAIEQFLVAKHKEEIVGFGRIREYELCSELCSLGVTESERLKGVGTQLVAELIKKAKKKVYLVCIIPEFFNPLGFDISSNYPQVLAKKLFRCETTLAVPEKYVVMESDLPVNYSSGHKLNIKSTHVPKRKSTGLPDL